MNLWLSHQTHEALSCLKGIVTSAGVLALQRPHARKHSATDRWWQWGGSQRSTGCTRYWDKGHKLFCSANKGINSQEITPGWNSHRCFVTSLRGSAQILQQTDQCRAILGYISPSVLQYVSCRNANCPLSLHLCTAGRVSFHHSATNYAEMCVNEPHDQIFFFK